MTSINALQENLKSETAKLDSLISSLGNVKIATAISGSVSAGNNRLKFKKFSGIIIATGVYVAQCMLVALINSSNAANAYGQIYTIYNSEVTISQSADIVTIEFNGDYGHLILISAESVPEITK